jgi:hypothetical protein
MALTEKDVNEAMANGEPTDPNQLLASPTQPNEPPKLNLSALSPKELLAALDSLKPTQLRAVRDAAVAAGVAPASPTSESGTVLPDGRVRVTVTFDSDLGAQLKLWAEAQNETLATFLVSAMTAYVQADWQGMAATG